jgi:hypothetical protein
MKVNKKTSNGPEIGVTHEIEQRIVRAAEGIICRLIGWVRA